jgi:hypothetical protein
MPAMWWRNLRLTPKMVSGETPPPPHQRPASFTLTLGIILAILIALGLLVLWYTR